MVQAVGVCTDAAYFSANAGVRSVVSPSLALSGIPIRGSATDVLASLRAATLGRMDLMTDHEVFTIILGNAIKLEFLPNQEFSDDPDDSRLAAVTYNFGPQYLGRILPELSVPTDRK